MTDLNPYQTLGVTKSFTSSELVQAYRQRSKETHPDANPEKTTEEFIRVAEAYRILADPALRELYDRTGTVFADVAAYRELVLSSIAHVIETAVDKILNSDQVFEEANILAMVRDAFSKSRSQFATLRVACEREISKLERAHGRIRGKADAGRNLFEATLAKKLAVSRQALTQAIKNEQVSADALLELDKYETDETAPMSAFAGYTFNSGSRNA